MQAYHKEFERLGQRLLTDDLVEGASPGRVMDWEPSVEPMQLNYQKFLQEKIDTSILHLSSQRCHRSDMLTVLQ